MAKLKLGNQFKQLQLWHLLAALLLSVLASVWLLRQNNLQMIELRDQVVLIDEQSGDITQIEPALDNLRNYVTGHMNADLGQPLELPGSYNQAVRDMQHQLHSSGAKAVFRKALHSCDRSSVPVSAQAQCVQDYVNVHGGNIVGQLDWPTRELFVYSFVSPAWSFDLAGLSVLTSGILLLALLVFAGLEYGWPRAAAYLTKDDLN